MGTPKQKNHKYRISESAVGKILTSVMEMTRKSEIAPSQFHDFMFATLNYIESEEAPSPDANVNPEKWLVIKEMVDRAARRSKAARERAARRRSLISSSSTSVSELVPENHPGGVGSGYETTKAVNRKDREEENKYYQEQTRLLRKEAEMKRWQQQSVVDYMRETYGSSRGY